MSITPDLLSTHLLLRRAQRVQTIAQANETIRRVRAALEERGFKVRPSSALGALFTKTERLLGQWTSQRESFDGLTLVQADEAVRIAEAVEAVVDEPAAQEAIHRITESDMHLSTRQKSKGKDMLWELDLLRSLRLGDVRVRLQEPPDLVVDLHGLLGTYGIACKKVYSEANVEKQLKSGCKQLQRTGIPGVVAFNLDDGQPERSILVQPTYKAAFKVLLGRNQAFLRQHERLFHAAVADGRCDGVLISITTPADIASMSPTFNRVRSTVIFTVRGVNQAAQMRLASLERYLNWMMPD